MDFLVSIVSSALTETGKFLCGYYPSIKNFISFKSNLSALETKMNSLDNLRNEVQEDVDSCDAQMKQWLGEVDKIMIEVDSVRKGASANNEKFCGCFFNCSERSRLSRETARILEEVERLLKAGYIAAKMVGRNYLAKAVEHIPGPCIENQATASKNLAKVMDLLHDDDVKRIGVWGMGGVGKTTLVKNLNNKLKDNSSRLPFGIIIWATVSQKLDLRKVQIQIAERLNLEVKVEESEESIAKRLHRRLQKKKFLLILDDVWETIDLDSLGVPQPEDHANSKILFTSRSFEVCRKMKTDKQVKVEVLKDEEPWLLFKKNAGKVATLKHIEPIARAVAEECGGLPLAIITVGKAMREKTRLELWKDALSELRSSDVPDIEGIENTVFKPLKLSYDSLRGKNIKPCFLYCSLYPEDFSIDESELVKCWLGEDLIDGQKNYEYSYNRGIALIENLKDTCLLEQGAREGTVKMHDVVRNVAIWISSSLGDGCKALVRSGIGLTQISISEISTALKRISFMHNKITELPDCAICYRETMSLLLQGNLLLERISDGFLQAFQSLRVLNLCGARMELLPQSILKLGDLRVLLLRDCSFLKKLSPVGGLSKLRVLDCSGTCIKELPSEMRNLMNLSQLYLSRTLNLKTIQSGIMSSLRCLEVLDMSRSAYIWGEIQRTEETHSTFRELLCLDHLLVLSIRLEGIPCLGSRERTWVGRLRRFQFIIGTRETAFWQTELDGKRLTIIRHDVLNCLNNPLLSSATSLVLDCCKLEELLEMLARKRSVCFAGLKSVTIANTNLWELSRKSASTVDLLPNLEELHLLDVGNLESISELIDRLGLCLHSLRLIEVTKCPQLIFLLQYGNSTLNTDKLEVIKVSFCEKLCELFKHTAEEIDSPGTAVPKLRIIEVKNCKALRKLPLKDLNPDTIEEIRGDVVWWTKLEQGSDKNTIEEIREDRLCEQSSYDNTIEEVSGDQPWEQGSDDNTTEEVRGDQLWEQANDDNIIEEVSGDQLWEQGSDDNTIEEVSGDELWEQGSDENIKGRLQHVFKPVKDVKAQLERILTARYSLQDFERLATIQDGSRLGLGINRASTSVNVRKRSTKRLKGPDRERGNKQ